MSPDADLWPLLCGPVFPAVPLLQAGVFRNRSYSIAMFSLSFLHHTRGQSWRAYEIFPNGCCCWQRAWSLPQAAELWQRGLHPPKATRPRNSGPCSRADVSGAWRRRSHESTACCRCSPVTRAAPPRTPPTRITTAAATSRWWRWSTTRPGSVMTGCSTPSGGRSTPPTRAASSPTGAAAIPPPFSITPRSSGCWPSSPRRA